MNRINFACQRNRWPRILVITILISLNLTPVQAQDFIPPRAARAYALMSVAAYDAIIACWDGKYTYWAARPNMLDPTIVFGRYSFAGGRPLACMFLATPASLPLL